MTRFAIFFTPPTRLAGPVEHCRLASTNCCEDSLLQVDIQPGDLAGARAIASKELDHLEQYNCARYNLSRKMTQRWIDAGRQR